MIQEPLQEPEIPQINSISEFCQATFPLFRFTPHDPIAIYDANEAKLLELSTSADAFSRILAATPDERVNAFLNAAEHKFSDIILSADSIGKIGTCLENLLFKQFLDRIKPLLPEYIQSEEDVVVAIKALQFKKYLFEVGANDAKTNTFYAAIQTILPGVITSVKIFADLAPHISAENNPWFYDEMAIRLPQLIDNSADNVGLAICVLPDERGMALFNTMKPKLAEILTDEMDVVTLLEYTGGIPGLHAEVAKYLQDANPELLSGIESWYSDANAVEELLNPQMN